jgi:putative DNA primase/helicase
VALQSDQITKSTAVAPADRGDCALWLKFLKEATDGFHELIRFLQQSCGYALTGVTKEHALVFVYGSGGNGKSVFLNVLTSILKDYAETASTDTFTASKSDKHPTDIAKLRGARLVTASETEEGKAWAEARIKEMTAGGDISARFRTFFGHSEQENDDTP